VQTVFAHQVRTPACEVALVAAAVAFEQQGRHAHVEHRVTQEFEPFVVFGTPAAMREGAPQQVGLAEAVAQSLLQRLQIRPEAFTHRHYLDHPSYLISRYNVDRNQLFIGIAECPSSLRKRAGRRLGVLTTTSAKTHNPCEGGGAGLMRS
jgi:hypothetical protein